MIYSGTRPCIPHLSIPTLTKCVPFFTSYCRGYFFPHFIFTQCTTQWVYLKCNVHLVLENRFGEGLIETKWAHGLLLVGESNMRLNNTLLNFMCSRVRDC